jgi:hypothetical protein
MLMWGSNDYENLSETEKRNANKVFEELKSKFGYTQKTSWQALVFLKSDLGQAH